MKDYVWALTILFSIDGVISLFDLASGTMRTATPRILAFEIAMDFVFIAIALVLLARD